MGGGCVIGLMLSTSLWAVYLLLFTQKMRLYGGTSDTLVPLSQDCGAAPSARVHTQIKAADANGGGGRKRQPEELGLART